MGLGVLERAAAQIHSDMLVVFRQIQLLQLFTNTDRSLAN